jgi:hypothetical protein
MSEQYSNKKSSFSNSLDEYIALTVWDKFERTPREAFERMLIEHYSATEEEIKEFFRKYPPKRAIPLEFYNVNINNTPQKTDWISFKELLNNNSIKCLFHFTDNENIKSIKYFGGLYSLKYCEENNIPISYASSLESRTFDKKKGLNNYIRLSFVRKHPMLFTCIKEGRISNPKILEIDLEVIFWSETLISNTNTMSTINEIGKELTDLLKIKFEIISSYEKYYNFSESEKPFFQAEVLVKTHIPLKLIKFL